MKTVLVVDDHDSTPALLEVALSFAQVTRAKSTERAMTLIEEQSFDAIVTDVDLPQASGLELLSWIRSRSALPVVVITASPDPEVPQRATQLGANAFFSKPFSPSAVRQRLEELLGVTS